MIGFLEMKKEKWIVCIMIDYFQRKSGIVVRKAEETPQIRNQLLEVSRLHTCLVVVST